MSSGGAWGGVSFCPHYNIWGYSPHGEFLTKTEQSLNIIGRGYKRRGREEMNPIKLMVLVITFMQMNMGQGAAGKRIIKEALDVIRVLGAAIKDRRITEIEKRAVIKELEEFNKSAVALLEAIQIPE